MQDGFDLAILSGRHCHAAGLNDARYRIGSRPNNLPAHPLLANCPAPSGGRPSASHRRPLLRAGIPGLGNFKPRSESARRGAPPSRLRFDDAEAIVRAAGGWSGLACLPLVLFWGSGRVHSGTLIPLLEDVPSLIVTRALLAGTPHLTFAVRSHRCACRALPSPHNFSLDIRDV